MTLTRTHGRIAMAVALSCGVMAGAYARQGGSVDLKLKFHKGEIIKYKMKMTMSMTMPGMPGLQGKASSQPLSSTSSTSKQEVLRVLPDGSGEVRESADLTTGGGMFGQMGAQPPKKVVTTMVITPEGVMKDAHIEGQMAKSPMMGQFNQLMGGGQGGIHLPGHPIHPGETWTNSLDVPGVTSGGKIKSTFVKYGSYQGQRTAVIRTSITAPLNVSLGMLGGGAAGGGQNMTGTMHFVTDTDVSIAAGRMERTIGGGTVTIHMAMPAGQPGAQQMPNGLNMTMKMDINRYTIP